MRLKLKAKRTWPAHPRNDVDNLEQIPPQRTVASAKLGASGDDSVNRDFGDEGDIETRRNRSVQRALASDLSHL